MIDKVETKQIDFDLRHKPTTTLSENLTKYFTFRQNASRIIGNTNVRFHLNKPT